METTFAALATISIFALFLWFTNQGKPMRETDDEWDRRRPTPVGKDEP